MNTHPLEHNEHERDYFKRINHPSTGLGVAAYRRAVIATTGALPSWAKPRKPGPKPKGSQIG